MSPFFEQILVFAVMSILVALFTWIYMSDRRRAFRLWLLGWIAIFLHFAVPVVAHFLPMPGPLTRWVRVISLIVAGTFFLLSVSRVFRNPRQRALFATMITLAAVLYFTGITLGVTTRWFYIGLIAASTLSGLYQGIRHYKLRSVHLYCMVGVLIPFSAWGMWQAARGNPNPGMDFYLFGFFYITGLAYFRYFHRATPGVIFTSASFVAWGMVFPVGHYLIAHYPNAHVPGFFWDLPKYFVAFGMILTLFENQTRAATNAAAQYQALFEGNLAAVYVCSLEGKLLNCNSAFLKLYGFASKQEALSASDQSLYPEPAERDAFLDTVQAQGQVLSHDCRQRRQDGAIFWVLKRASVVNGDKETLIETTALDITERKQAEIALRQSEERFSAIFRKSPIACVLLSLDGIFLDVNETFLQIIGRPAEGVIGKNALQLGLWKQQVQRDRFFERLRGEGAVQNLEVEFKDANGHRHTGLYFATIVGVGKKQCIFGMLLDQTEKRDLEAKFLQSQKMESLGRLAGGVAHDFNNLLGVIGGFAELLEARLGENDLYRRYCTKIIETTQRASGLTRQLLTFSRKEITRPTPLQPDHAFRDLVVILPRLIGEDIELIINLSSTGTVVIDKTHFEQIIFNIAINSRDAMPNGGQLTIETEDIFRPSLLPSGSITINQYVAIRITDNGMGMSEETRLHAFEPFYTTKEPGRGTGLGLATVYGIVQQCMGDITLDSQPGKGTQVTIFLPALSEIEPGERTGPGEEIRKGSGTILLVEDETDLRSAGAEFLTGMGYSVICASSGAEALKLAREAGSIDLVVTDVIMPKMNGHELAAHLLHILPNAKLLFVSGYTDEVVFQGWSSHQVPFLQKPFSLKQLGTKVNELLPVAKGAGT